MTPVKIRSVIEGFNLFDRHAHTPASLDRTPNWPRSVSFACAGIVSLGMWVIIISVSGAVFNELL